MAYTDYDGYSIQELLAMIASGEKPDGTPISGGGGAAGGGGGGAVTVADGADVTQGAMADPIAAAGAAGTDSAKMRRLTADLAAVLAKLPATLGQTTMAGSTSVALASNQSAVPVVIDAAALAALETITATLDAGSLAALENITAVIDAGTLATLLAALETITVANLPAALGQQAMAASASVAIASNQSAVPTTSAVLTDVWDAVNHMVQVRQVALAGDTDSVTKTAVSTNRSGTITTGGTAQTVMASNTARRLLMFQNTSDSEMRLGLGVTPTATVGYQFAAGDALLIDSAAVPSDAISVFCATAGKTFAATEM